MSNADVLRAPTPPLEPLVVERTGRTSALSHLLRRIESRVVARTRRTVDHYDDSDPLADLGARSSAHCHCLGVDRRRSSTPPSPTTLYERQRMACEAAADARLLAMYRRAQEERATGLTCLTLRPDVSQRLYLTARLQWARDVILLEFCTRCCALYLCYADDMGLPSARGCCQTCAGEPLSNFDAMASALPSV